MHAAAEVTRDAPHAHAARASGLAFACVALLPLALMLTPPHVAGVPAKALAFEVLAFLALLLALTTRGVGRVLAAPTPASAGFLLLIAAALLSTCFAAATDVALRTLGFIAACGAAHFAALLTIDSHRRFHLLLAAAAAGALVVSVNGLAAAHAFGVAIAKGAASEADRAHFLRTPFFEHSYLALQATVPAALAACALLLLRPRRVPRLLLAPLLLLVCALPFGFLWMVLSRAAWFTAAVTLALVAGAAWRWRSRSHLIRARGASGAHETHEPRVATDAPRAPTRARNHRALPWILLSLLVLAIAGAWLARAGAFGYTIATAFDRVASLLDPRQRLFNFSRLLVWQDALRLAGDHAPVGVGPGGFGAAFGAYHAGQRPLSHAHNQFLHTFAELGVIGLVGLFLALVHPLALALRALTTARAHHAGTHARSRDRDRARSALAVLAVHTSVLLFCAVESPLLFAASAALLAICAGASARLFAGADAPRHALDPTRTRAREPARWPRPVALLAAVLLLLAAAPATWRHARASAIGVDAADALAAGDFERATALAGHALEYTPDHPEVLAILGHARRKVGDHAGAAAAFGQFQVATPGLSDVLVHRAAALAELRRFDEAIELLRVAYARAPAEAEPEVGLYLANILFRARRFDEARLLFQELLRRNVHGRHPVLLRRLAETLLNLGRERTLATELLRRYAGVARDAEARYARALLADIDRFYATAAHQSPQDAAPQVPREHGTGGTGTRADDGANERR